MTSPAWTGPVDPPPVGPTPLVGDVIEFDEPRGLGVVEYGPGAGWASTARPSPTVPARSRWGRWWPFIVSAGRLGRLEARRSGRCPVWCRPGRPWNPPRSGPTPRRRRLNPGADRSRRDRLGPGFPGGAGRCRTSAVPDRTPPSGTPGVGFPAARGGRRSPGRIPVAVARPSGGPPPPGALRPPVVPAAVGKPTDLRGSVGAGSEGGRRRARRPSSGSAPHRDCRGCSGPCRSPRRCRRPPR